MGKLMLLYCDTSPLAKDLTVVCQLLMKNYNIINKLQYKNLQVRCSFFLCFPLIWLHLLTLKIYTKEWCLCWAFMAFLTKMKQA